MISLIKAALAALTLIGPPAAQTAATSTDCPLAQELRERDQRLLAAVHSGGRAEWAAATAPDFVYVEEGELTPRERFLKELKPDGGSALQIREHHVTRTGDVALVVHTDEVPLRPGDLRPPGTYLMTEAWQIIDGCWKLHVVHVDAVHAPPPVATLAVVELDALEGRYSRDGAHVRLSRDADGLRAEASNSAESRLEPETRDVFFDRRDLRRRVIFQRDAAGAVTGFVRRDENHDKTWTRDTAAPQPSR